jgi:hypothetical protein
MHKGVVTSVIDFDIALFYFMGAMLLRRMYKKEWRSAGAA